MGNHRTRLGRSSKERQEIVYMVWIEYAPGANEPAATLCAWLMHEG